MHLSYRGAPYEFNPPPLEMVDAGITTKYRGVSCTVRHPHLPQGVSPSLRLTYRGVSYSKPQAF